MECIEEGDNLKTTSNKIYSLNKAVNRFWWIPGISARLKNNHVVMCPQSSCEVLNPRTLQGVLFIKRATSQQNFVLLAKRCFIGW